MAANSPKGGLLKTNSSAHQHRGGLQEQPGAPTDLSTPARSRDGRKYLAVTWRRCLCSWGQGKSEKIVLGTDRRQGPIGTV